MTENLMMYEKHSGDDRPTEYGYGPEWVGMAMYMDDFPRFYTEEDAMKYWELKLKKELEENELRRKAERESEAASYYSLYE